MIRLIVILTLSVVLSACYKSERSEINVNTTFGQELVDLKKALDSGAIDQQQYKKMLNRISKRRLKLDLDDVEDS